MPLKGAEGLRFHQTLRQPKINREYRVRAALGSAGAGSLFKSESFELCGGRQL